MRSLSRLLALLIVAVTASFAIPALATPESDLAVAENSYAALDYTSAIAAADQILMQRGLSHDVLMRATRVSALSHAALGNSDVAKKQFVRLLQYDPDFKVDTKLGPRFTDPFAEARGYWQAQGRKPGMDVQAISQWKQRGQIRVTTRDPLNVIRHVSIGFRWAPAHDYTVVVTDPVGGKQADLPPNPAGSSRLEYYVRALDGNDNAVFEEGSPDLPKNVVVNEPPRVIGEEKKSIFASPLFYIIGGAVVAAAAIGGYYAFRPTEFTAASTGHATPAATCGGAPCL